MNSSENLNELFTALAKAQAEYTTADKSKNNPFFKSKYASYETLVEATRPALTKYGLAVIATNVRNENGDKFLRIILSHSSGQYIYSDADINPVKTDIQALGSYRTYLLRYGYKELTGVVTQDEEEDDDGEAAMARDNKPFQVNDCITKEQVDILSDELQGEYEIKEDMFKKLNISSLGQIKKTQFQSVLKRIREIKGIK